LVKSSVTSPKPYYASIPFILVISAFLRVPAIPFLIVSVKVEINSFIPSTIVS